VTRLVQEPPSRAAQRAGRRAAVGFNIAAVGVTGAILFAALSLPAAGEIAEVMALAGIAWMAAGRPLLLISRLSVWLGSFSAWSLTDFAAFLAGRRRPVLRDEWRAHLSGESGHELATWRKVRQALGFVAAAIKLRLADAADLAWRPADAVLGSRTLSNLFVGGPVIVVLFAIVHHDGRFGLVTDIQDAGELGAFLYGVIRTGRWWRGVKPPEPRARRARE
jgi:hypothetical protein